MPVLKSKKFKSQKVGTRTRSKETAARPQNSTAMPKSTRQNATHIFFWGGPLSNWHGGSSYSGRRAFELLLPKLAELDISHPPPEAFSSRLLVSVDFRCGEQWMMAMKGWLFERDIELSERLFPDGGDAEQEFELLRREMLGPTQPPPNEEAKRAMYDSCLCKCLRTRSPMEQKNYGRRCRNFDIKVWDIASVPVVVACQIARAEADDDLRRLYLQSGDRVFVEGSPRDKVWGVGIRWDKAPIENPSNWRGENRLGVCHGIACKAIRELWKEKADAEQVC